MTDKPFNFIRQHNYCVSGKKAVKSYPDGVYLCVDHGGICRLKKCEAIHKHLDSTKSRDKIIETS